MKLKTVFQKTLSTKVRIFMTHYVEAHNLVDLRKVKKKIENK